MARELKWIDISHSPELLRLAEQVRATSEPRLLRRDGEDLAVVSPVTVGPKRHASSRKTKADEAAFLASAGSWKDFDSEAFVAYLRERRAASSRPPVEL